ncbi:MAG TPA: amidohydrolase family protein, partial [Flavitalea sp.]|nr:amidohydrolase family protein [Flavitalea sp.]
PGFINCHCHLELCHLSGRIPEKTGLVPFLTQVMNFRTEAPSIDAMEFEEKNMLEEGIIAVADICNTSNTFELKSRNRLRYHSFIETAGFIPSTAEKRYQIAKQLADDFASLDHTCHRCSVTPHAPYSVSATLFDLIAENNRLLSIHNQEAEEENEFFLTGIGPFNDLYERMNIDISEFIPPRTNSLQAVAHHFKRPKSILLVHNVATSQSDIEWLRQNNLLQKISWTLCPNANLYISGSLPDVNLLKKNNAVITVGTDSLASNHQLSILAELKTLQKNFPTLTIVEMLQWITLNGAKALMMDELLGSFEKGKQPGVVLIEKVEMDSIQHAISRRIL